MKYKVSNIKYERRRARAKSAYLLRGLSPITLPAPHTSRQAGYYLSPSRHAAARAPSHYQLSTNNYQLPRRAVARRGVTVVLVLVFAAAFGMSVMALASFIFVQAKLGQAKEVRERALGIAEAGLDYYHWYLLHNPEDLEDGTGAAGPYVHTYADPEGDDIGTFTLDIAGNLACGEIQSIDITSTGTVDIDSRFTRTISARHMKPSVAAYSGLVNANIVAGSNAVIFGPYHSNFGLRMDGVNNSLVTSGVSTWSASNNCDGGSPSPGVCGGGPNSVLWQFPVDTISFSGMTDEALAVETAVQTGGGVHLSDFTNGDDSEGYHLIFQSDGTVDVYTVTGTDSEWSYDSTDGPNSETHDAITDETFQATYALSPDCPVIFSEAKAWVEGVVAGKATVIVANSGNYVPEAILPGNITYADEAGTDGFTLISEGYIRLPYNAPNDTVLYGIYAALGDKFGRNYYDESDVGAFSTRNSLTVVGTVLSARLPGVTWGGTCAGSSCGYANRTYSYDSALITDPPPFTPATNPQERFFLWREN